MLQDQLWKEDKLDELNSVFQKSSLLCRPRRNCDYGLIGFCSEFRNASFFQIFMFILDCFFIMLAKVFKTMFSL